MFKIFIISEIGIKLFQSTKNPNYNSKSKGRFRKSSDFLLKYRYL